MLVKGGSTRIPREARTSRRATPQREETGGRPLAHSSHGRFWPFPPRLRDAQPGSVKGRPPLLRAVAPKDAVPDARENPGNAALAGQQRDYQPFHQVCSTELRPPHAIVCNFFAEFSECDFNLP